MSLDELQEPQETCAENEVSLDLLAAVLRDVLAAAPEEGLARVVQEQIARSAATQEPSAEPAEDLLAAVVAEPDPV